MFDLRLTDESAEPINLRLFLAADGQPLTETWLYQYRHRRPMSERDLEPVELHLKWRKYVRLRKPRRTALALCGPHAAAPNTGTAWVARWGNLECCKSRHWHTCCWILAQR